MIPLWVRVVAAFNRSPVRIATFQIEFREDPWLALVGVVWLYVGHAKNSSNLCAQSRNCGADVKLGEPYESQARVADGEWGIVYEVCHGVLL